MRIQAALQPVMIFSVLLNFQLWLLGENFLAHFLKKFTVQHQKANKKEPTWINFKVSIMIFDCQISNTI